MNWRVRNATPNMCQLFQSKEEAITIKELVKQCFAPTFIYPNPDTT